MEQNTCLYVWVCVWRFEIITITAIAYRSKLTLGLNVLLSAAKEK